MTAEAWIALLALIVTLLFGAAAVIYSAGSIRAVIEHVVRRQDDQEKRQGNAEDSCEANRRETINQIAETSKAVQQLALTCGNHEVRISTVERDIHGRRSH